MINIKDTIKLYYQHRVDFSRPLKVKGGKREQLRTWLSTNNITTWNANGFSGSCFISHKWDYISFKSIDDKFLFVMSCGDLINI